MPDITISQKQLELLMGTIDDARFEIERIIEDLKYQISVLKDPKLLNSNKTSQET